MDRKRYNQILEKLNKTLIKNDDSVSASGIPFINRETDFDVLSDNQLILIHSLLHRFYGMGGTKMLEKQDIEYLHKKIRGKIKHGKTFDMLDENDDKKSN